MLHPGPSAIPDDDGNIFGFSGGKDSTVLARLMREKFPDMKFSLLFTPTGNELPEVRTHIDRTAAELGVELVIPRGPTLAEVIDAQGALPNWRMRFCTRMVRIVPCVAYLQSRPGCTLFVGLRADEEEREGLYGPYAKYRYPLREFGMGIKEVFAFLKERDIVIPKRTDCAVCYYQKIREWWELWRDHPEEYAKGEAWEEQTGHTFRSPGRDTWPAALKDLRKEFERGRKIRGLKVIRNEAEAPCRVCRL